MTGRLKLLMSGMLLLWAVLALRLVHVQWREHGTYREHAVAQQALTETISARLGDIVDRHGRLLATTSRGHSLFVDPSKIAEPEAVASQLAEPLGLEAAELARRIVRDQHRKFLWVKRHLSEREVDHIHRLELPDSAWGLREEFRRTYPQGSLAAHVLGWRNIDGVPQAGLERTLNASLQGTDGQRTLVRDARGYVIEILEEVTQPPRQGGTVTLTLDATIQRIAEDQLDRLVEQWRPRSVSAVVMDPQTGEILAMGCRPTFDPAHPAAAPAEAWMNHAVSSAYEPGSTIKPCIMAWAVDRQLVSPKETFVCNGTYRMGRRVLHDHRAFGTLDVAGIITLSSNIGMAQVGRRLGNERLHAAVGDFGFGQKTGVELPGESAGIVRSLEAWDEFSTGSVPMGQEIAVTPLQMISAHAALANGGMLITPHLVLRDSGHGDRGPTGVLATQVLDGPTARWMVTGPMVEVVRRGTARKAAIDGLAVFAKTGTAQKYDPSTGAYSTDRFVTSCLCGAPADDPRLLVLITVDEPSSKDDPSGGKVAAPAASDILRRALDSLRSPAPSDRMFRMAADGFERDANADRPSRR